VRLSCCRLFLLLVFVGFYFIKYWYDKNVGIPPYQTVQKVVSLDKFKVFLHNLKLLMTVYAPAPTNIDLLKPVMKQAFTFYVTDFKLELLEQNNDFEEKVQPVIIKYQQKLADLTKQLNKIIISRLYPYVYLNPQYIPNSVIV